MVETIKVITQERFSQGLRYEDFLNQPGVEKETLIENMIAFHLAPEDAEFFKSMVKRQPMKVIAIVGDNGGGRDVHRALPVMMTIAQASGMDMRVFPKSGNLDLMNLYLNQGRFQSIPVFAFLNEHFNPLGHWIERPKLATALMDVIKSEPNTKKLSEKELTQERNARYKVNWPAWRLEQVRELKELFSDILQRENTAKI